MAKMKAPESMGSGSIYLEHSEANAGHYLMCVTDAAEGSYKTKDGDKMMDGFSFECEVIGGHNAGKQTQLKFYDGKESSSDHGEFARKKQFAALVATDVCKPDQLGTEFEYDPTEAVGAVFVVEMELGKPASDGKRYLDIRYANIYHVDDPQVAKIKMDDEQRAKIASLKPAYRHPGDYFAKLATKPEKAEKSAPKEKLNFDDL